MYWPPKWVANNQVTLNDAKYIDAEALPGRHDQFAMPATILSPWLSWADIDAAWSPSDPMMRILLIGDPGTTLRCVNVDTHGSIIRLGAPALGEQAWEVVSFFDWYDDGIIAKKGCMAWCRLWPYVAIEGEVEGVEMSGLLDWGSDPAIGFGASLGDFAEETLVVVGIVWDGDGVDIDTITCGGVEMTLAADGQYSTDGGMNIAVYYAIVPAGDAIGLSVGTTDDCSMGGSWVGIVGATGLTPGCTPGVRSEEDGVVVGAQDAGNDAVDALTFRIAGARIAGDPLVYQDPILALHAEHESVCRHLTGVTLQDTGGTFDWGMDGSQVGTWASITVSFS